MVKSCLESYLVARYDHNLISKAGGRRFSKVLQSDVQNRFGLRHIGLYMWIIGLNMREMVCDRYGICCIR